MKPPDEDDYNTHRALMQESNGDQMSERINRLNSLQKYVDNSQKTATTQAMGPSASPPHMRDRRGTIMINKIQPPDNFKISKRYNTNQRNQELKEIKDIQ